MLTTVWRERSSTQIPAKAEDRGVASTGSSLNHQPRFNPFPVLPLLKHFKEPETEFVCPQELKSPRLRIQILGISTVLQSF